MAKSRISWKGGYAFEADLEGHRIMIDIPTEKGGTNLGPSPQSLLMPALAACSSVGVVGILKKMRVPEFELDIDVEAQKAETHPQFYTKITITYNFAGKGLDAARLHKAVSVSEDRYCGVYAMLSKTAEINSLITLNGEAV